MSLTTESSLTQRSGGFTACLRRWICPLMCPCLPRRRRVSPTQPLPLHSDLMTLGKKGGRLICVLHYQPHFNDLLLRRQSFAVRLRQVRAETEAEELDDSVDEYWFTKWTLPLRTVKRFQLENLRKQFRASLARNDRNRPPVKPAIEPSSVSVFAKDQSANIIEQAALEAAAKINGAAATPPSKPGEGISNPGFEPCPSDPVSVAPAKPPPAFVQSKPVLYFIHGAGESSESWRHISQYFACLHYEVVAVDLLGHGYSSTPTTEKSYTFRKLLGDVIRVFDEHVYSGKKAVIIGHGYGCSFAVALSRQRSGHVSLLALLSSGGPTPLAPPVTWRRELKLPASVLRCCRSLLPCGVKRNVLYGPRGKSTLHATTDFQSLPSYVQRHLAVGQSWPEGDVAFHRKISVPTLLVHGLKDRFVSLVEMCEMERTIPRAFLEVIPESGHDLMADVPDQLCKMLRKFIQHWER